MSAKVPTGTKHKYVEKGSKQKGGRPLTVTRTKQADGSWKTTSENKARDDYETAHHTDLPKSTDVDHKDNNKMHDSLSNLQAMSHSANVAKEDRHRVGKD